ncbi:MAG: SDR family oxidoreductase [Rhodospirillales bacterium]|nr:SDR family oxidoreductase [Rhodospirillales bacterium]
MDLGLKGKNAAISGASQGMGHAIASALADEGCNVAISARGEERLEQAVKEFEAKGVKAVGVICDLSTSEGCKKFIDEAVAGLGSLDILVNNVGGMIPGTLDSVSDEQWAQILNVNLLSHVWTTKAAVSHLKKSKAGRILNVSGVTGKQLLPGALTTTLPNAAIIGFSKIMAADLAPAGITVNNICPGFTNTESWGPRAEAMAKVRNTTADGVRQAIAGQTLLNRWAEPQEIGDVAAFMVSEKNSYMTGTTVEVCGGFTKYL